MKIVELNPGKEDTHFSEILDHLNKDAEDTSSFSSILVIRTNEDTGTLNVLHNMPIAYANLILDYTKGIILND